MLIGPFEQSKWNTLKRLKASIDNKETAQKRREREKILFQVVLNSFKEAA